MPIPSRFCSLLVLGAVAGVAACTSADVPAEAEAVAAEEALAAPCTLGTTCPTIQLVKAQPFATPNTLDGWVRGDVFHGDEDVVFYRQSTTAPLILPAGKRIVLSGSATADTSWNVDDGLLVEVLRSNGSVHATTFIGAGLDLQRASGPIPRTGREAFEFAGGEIDLTSLVPAGQTFRLRVSAINGGDPGPANAAYVSDVFLRVSGTEPAPSTTPFDLATACPGPAVTYAQLLAKFPPATTSTTLGSIVLDGRKRACHDQTGCAAWEPAGEVPFYQVTYTSGGYRFSANRSIAVPARGKATLSATSTQVTLALALDGAPGLTLSDSVSRDRVDFDLNPLEVGGTHVQVGGWSSGPGSYVWFHQDKVTSSCLFATSTGRVYGASGAYTEYQAVFYGTY